MKSEQIQSQTRRRDEKMSGEERKSVYKRSPTLTERMVENRHYWIESLRIFLGGLLFYKGYYFVENISVIYELIEVNLGISPFILVHYVVLAHLIGGLMIMIGLLTRLAIFVQIPILAGAVFLVHARDILGGPTFDLEYSILVLILLITFFFYGAGKWSVDHQIARKQEE